MLHSRARPSLKTLMDVAGPIRSSPSRDSTAASEMQPSHEFVDHVGEVHLRVRAGSLAGLLAEAGRALAEVALGQPPPEAERKGDHIDLRATDREALLVDWLNELIYLAETRRQVPTRFDLIEVTDRRVLARLQTVPVAEAPSFVKAATYHGLRIRRIDGGLQADVVLDI